MLAKYSRQSFPFWYIFLDELRNLDRLGFWTPPQEICHLIKLLESSLKGCTPQKSSHIDHRGWGVSNYLVKQGYQLHMTIDYLPPKSLLLHTDGLPKINIFCWIMAQGKLLCIENFTKCGWHRPSWCALRKRQWKPLIKSFWTATTQPMS